MASRLTPMRAARRKIWTDTRWKKTSARVIKRDGACRRCGTTTRLTAHHLDYNDPFNEARCICLCQSCHGRADGGKSNGGHAQPLGGRAFRRGHFSRPAESQNRFLDTIA